MAGAKQFDPAAALAAAMEVFHRRGYAATSMHDLEEATGLGRGSIYNAFGDKHALFLATLECYVAAQREELSHVLRESPRAIDGIRLAVRSGAVHICTAEGRSGCFVGRTVMERADQDEQAAAAVQRAIDGITGLFEQALERAQDEGDFPRDRDPAITARFFVTSIQGLSLMAKVTDDPKLIRAIAEEILHALDS